MHVTPHVLDLAKRGAALRLRELADEVKLLLDLFPDLSDAFDPDELPVSFILTRDGAVPTAPAEPAAGSGGARARRGTNRRMKQAWTQRRAGSKS